MRYTCHVHHMLALMLVTFAVSSGHLWAQEEPTIQGYQFGMGGSFERLNRLPQSNKFGGFDFLASFTQNRRLRWTMDGGFHFAGRPPDFDAGQMLYLFHFGPELTQRKDRMTWFAHVLPGYTAWSLGNITGEGGFSSYVTQGGFSISAGGGVDLHAGKHFDVRLQADYISAWLRQGSPSSSVAAKLPKLESPYANMRLAMFLLGTIDRKDLPSERTTPPAQRFQVGGGPSYMRSSRLEDRHNFGGFVLQGSWAQNNRLRWVLDIGAQFAGTSFKAPKELPLAQDLIQGHLGPEMTWRSPRRTLFAHVLPGATGWLLSDNHSYGTTPYKEIGFSLEAGGGIDVHQGERVDVRFQADYMPAWFNPSIPTTTLNLPIPPSTTANGNFRVSTIFLWTTLRHEKRQSR